jgi:hypothetical protein
MRGREELIMPGARPVARDARIEAMTGEMGEQRQVGVRGEQVIWTSTWWTEVAT